MAYDHMSRLSMHEMVRYSMRTIMVILKAGANPCLEHRFREGALKWRWARGRDLSHICSLQRLSYVQNQNWKPHFPSSKRVPRGPEITTADGIICTGSFDTWLFERNGVNENVTTEGERRGAEGTRGVERYPSFRCWMISFYLHWVYQRLYYPLLMSRALKLIPQKCTYL